MKCTIVKATSGRYTWKECKECGTFICSRCGSHCHSIVHDSNTTAICPDCEAEDKK